MKKSLKDNLQINIWYERFKELDQMKRPVYSYSIFLIMENKPDPVPFKVKIKGADEFVKAIEKSEQYKPIEIKVVQYESADTNAAEIMSDVIEMQPDTPAKKSYKAKKTQPNILAGLGDIDEFKKKLREEVLQQNELEQLKAGIQARDKSIQELEKTIEEQNKELDKYEAMYDDDEKRVGWGRTFGQVAQGLLGAAPKLAGMLRNKGLGDIVDALMSKEDYSSPENGGAEGATITKSNDPRQVYYNTIVEYCKSLTQDQFKQVYVCFDKWSEDFSRVTKALEMYGVNDANEYLKNIENARQQQEQPQE